MKQLLCITILCALIHCTGCSAPVHPAHPLHPGAASERTAAPALMIQYGCPTCHVIRGVPGASGKVGPSLVDLAQRSYLAGTLQNSPSDLVLWLQHPQAIHPGTAMPEMNVTAADAKEIASFLQTH